MARSLTWYLRKAMFDQQTDLVVVLLVTIEHPTLGAPIRICSNVDDIISQGRFFARFPFELTLPDDIEDRVPRAQIVVDNVSREIVALVRELPTQPTVTIEVITADQPDTIAETYGPFLMQNAEWDARTVTAELVIDDRSQEQFPEGVYDPAGFPALFKAV